MFVCKTHANLTPPIVKAVEEGLACVQVHARDPRDVALSMRDAAKRGAGWGRDPDDRLINDPDDAFPRLQVLVARHAKWAKLPGALCLDYESTAFSTRATAQRIAEHMSLSPAPRRDAFAVKRRFTQLNLGRSQRYRTEMTEQQKTRWYHEFEDHIDTYCPAPTGQEWSSRLETGLGRLIRKLTFSISGKS